MTENRLGGVPPAATYVVDPTYPHRPRSLSPETLAVTGFAPSEFLMNPTLFVSRIHPADLKRILVLYADTVLHGEASAEYRFMHRDGAYRWLHDRAALTRDGDGAPAAIVVRCADITGSRRREAELLGREEYLRRLIEHASDVITVLTLDGVIQYQSPSIRRLAGLTPEEMIGRNGFDYIHPDDVAHLRRMCGPALQHAPDPAPVEFRHRHADGSWRVVEAVASPIIEDGDLVGTIVNARDISDRRRIEEQLQHARRMEAIGQLAGGIAHDFNNLLTAILGYAELLAESLPADSRERADVEEIRRAGGSAAMLTRQLLAFSRRQILEPVVMNLNRAVADAARLVGRLLREHIRLRVSLDEGVGPVRADASQLDQVLVNVGVNASDAMPDGGELTIATRAVELSAPFASRHVQVPPGRYAVLDVKDTGVGMGPEVLDRLFEPFFTTKPRGRGTGLGMAAVYGIVSQSGGYLVVESAPAAGTQVSIFLPVVQDGQDGVAAGRASAATARATSRPWTILFVEDNEPLRAFAHRVLASNGHTVLVAEHAEDALRKEAGYEGPLDLLLTDIVMPGLSGPELAQHLRQRRPGLRCLYTSGYTDDALLRHGIVRGEVAFLPKPFTAQRLIEKVHEVLAVPGASAPGTRQH